MTMTDQALAAAVGGPDGRRVPTAREGQMVRLFREMLLSDEIIGQVLVEALEAGPDGVRLTGASGFLPEMVKAVLERGLATELADHLGYDKGDAAGRNKGNSRNGTTPKTLVTEIGPVPLDVPRDREGTFTPRLVPKGVTRLGGGLDDMIISLYAGGMTVRCDARSH